MKRSPPLRLEHLEDRLTPTTLTVSFVPDGTQIGSEQSQLFRDMNPTASTASWQSGILGMLQNAASQYGITLQVVADDGASMNGSAPEDGQLRIAAVDQAFQTHGSGMMIPGGGDLIVESQVTFGVGLGLIGPNGGAPAQPPVNNAPPGTVAPNTPPSATLPFILPFPTAFGNLYPTTTSGPSGPATGPSGPTYTSGPSAPTATSSPTATSGPSGATATSGPTYTSGPSGPTYTSGPTYGGSTATSGPSDPTGPTGP